MKTINYTYMRDHLTEVLNDLRNGEQIKVTQRGKADLILNSGRDKALNLKVKAAGWEALTATEIEAWNNSEEARAKSSGGCFITISPLNSSDREIATKKGLSFKDAKERTKARHAAVIKILGDK